MMRMRMVLEITETHPHVALDMIWHCDGDADAEHRVRNAQGVQIAIAQK